MGGGESQTCFLLTLPLSLFDFGTVMAVNVRASDDPLQIDPPRRLCSLTCLCSQTFTLFFPVAFGLSSKDLKSVNCWAQMKVGYLLNPQGKLALKWAFIEGNYI